MTREADNTMTGSDFDWMVSNHAVWEWKAPVKASVSGVSLLQFSPFFRFHLSPFPPETTDTQAIPQGAFIKNINILLDDILLTFILYSLIK